MKTKKELPKLELKKKFDDRLKKAKTWQDFRLLAHSIGEKQVSSKLESEAYKKAIKALRKAAASNGSSIADGYAGKKAVSLWVSTLCGEVSEEQGTFTVDGEEIPGAMRFEGKVGGSLIWELPASAENALKVLLMDAGWKSTDVKIDETEGFESSEGKGGDALDSEGNAIENYEDFEGDGCEDVLYRTADYWPPRELGVNFKGGRSVVFSRENDEPTWTVRDTSRAEIGTVDFDQLLMSITRLMFA